MMKQGWPPISNKKADLNLFILKLFLDRFVSLLHRIHINITLINCKSFKQICPGKVLKQIDLDLPFYLM